MAKSGKKKTGLHKMISSVLKDVPIPQGVHDWQPPDTREPDKTADVSEAAATSKISTVFKGVTAESGNDAGQSAGKHAQGHADEPTATAATEDRQSPPSPHIEKPHRPEQSAATATQPRRPNISNYVVHSGNSQSGSIKWPLMHRIKARLSALRPGVGAARRKAMVVLVPVFVIVMVFAYSRIFSTTPQETGAATKKNAPVTDAGNSDSEIGWQIPEPLPAAIADQVELPGPDAAQDKEQDESAGKLSVRGIVFSKHKPSAVIGTQIVHVGDTIGDVAVVQINKDSVVFEKAGKRWLQKVHD